MLTAGEPIVSQCSYIAEGDDGRWKTLSCENRLPYICEQPAALSASMSEGHCAHTLTDYGYDLDRRVPPRASLDWCCW